MNLNRTPEPRGDVARLPKWAQSHIRSLQSEITALRKTFVETQQASPIFTDAYGAPKYIDGKDDVRFELAEGYVDVSISRDYPDALVLNGSDAITVQPWVTNVILVKLSRL